ncbi:MAG: Uncharacterized protein G01um1014106_496 [Parcubacteria group bacterium Gr01-1014_106]|nr:MAG: Uncharacterized protein G01um1014106_496 [Parcubacteria group bacterium Gr01-1014_106]
MLPYALTVHPAIRWLRRPFKMAQAFVACAVFGFPGRKLRIVGVTGTDGKTTTVHLTVKALESAGYTVGAISTIHFQVGTKLWTNRSKLTTPGPWELQKLLAHMVRAGCHYVVLECSSHRLDQEGFWGIPFDVAVITNITREHFDYHKDFDDYARAKRRLFMALRHPAKQLPFRKNIDPGGRVPTAAVVNLDDERCRPMLEEQAERKYGFTLQADRGKLTANGGTTIVTARPAASPHQLSAVSSQLYIVRAGEREALLDLKLPGRFNLQNALAAIAVGISQGIALAQITRELSDVERIPGRMDQVKEGQPFTVIIDYAVTPAAFEALYAEIRNSKFEIRNFRIIHVFGAAGGRDRGKRPLLGEIAGRHANLVILADEDPYSEDPEHILRGIEPGLVAAGMRSATLSEDAALRSTAIMNDSSAAGDRGAVSGEGDRKQFLRIRDRRLAIREALNRAKSGDVVLVTGKGAEETMALGDQRIPWNDRKVITEELMSLRGASATRKSSDGDEIASLHSQ